MGWSSPASGAHTERSRLWLAAEQDYGRLFHCFSWRHKNTCFRCEIYAKCGAGASRLPPNIKKKKEHSLPRTVCTNLIKHNEYSSPHSHCKLSLFSHKLQRTTIKLQIHSLKKVCSCFFFFLLQEP